MNRLSRIASASAAALMLLSTAPARAGHVYGGITDTNLDGVLGAGDALSFVNNVTGAIVTGPSQGLQTMPLVTVGVQAGYYQTSNISFTALAGTGLDWTGDGSTASGAYRSESAFAASAGSYIELRIDGVTGPNGARFSFWDAAVNASGPALTYTIGASGPTSYWNLTDPTVIIGDGTTPLPVNPNSGALYAYPAYAPTLDGLPGGFAWNDADGDGPGTAVTDPYGHVHGRSFTVDTPGDYTVSYILHDATGQQADSAPFVVSYSAVPEPGTVALFAIAGGAALLLRRRKSFLHLVLFAFAATALPVRAHQHFDAGIVDENHNGLPDAGEALRFVNPPAANAIFHFYPKAAGLEYGGYYSLDDDPRPLFPNDSFTFTALSDGDVDIAAPFHAAAGSSIWAQITSVTGPAGAEVGFWDENWGLTHTTPTQSFLTGESTGGFSFVLSESSFPPDPDEDPQGHIHERAWTVTQPGDYYVTFTLIDRGTNGPGGGPIHDPSVPYTFHFLAVPEPGTLGLLGLSAAAGWFWRRRAMR